MMRKLMEWANNEKAIHPALISGINQCQLVRDGVSIGYTARFKLLTKLAFSNANTIA